MTIGLGVLCKDGVVLGADSQESLTFSKVNRPKVFELKAHQAEVKVVLVGAGDGVFLDALKDKIEDALALADATLDSLRLEVEATLVGYCKIIWSVYGDSKDRPDAQMLIGIRAQDGLALLHSDGPKVRRVTDYESIGFGGDFATYHLKGLLRSSMTTEMVCPLAAYVLDVVKGNVEYCGGETHIFVIPATGDVEQKSSDYISTMTDFLQNNASATSRNFAMSGSQELMQSILKAYSDKDERRIAYLRDALAKLRVDFEVYWAKKDSELLESEK